jgi:4-amino-4-deoxy-L-arabinose transferase-like glycosyltransferase
MPDIGLLQGAPPKPRAPAAAPLHASAPEAPPVRIRAHAAVVSPDDLPIAAIVATHATADDAPAAAAAAEPVEPVEPKPPAPEPPTPARSSAAAAPLSPKDLLWLLLALLVIIGTGLGIRDPWPADEPRFASLARDMVQTGEWLFPRVGGDLYQDKPPLFFWLLALSYTVFGAFKGWFLIPSFLAAAGVLFLVYDFGRRTVGREAGLAGAVLVLTTLQFVLAMRGAQIDPTLCLLTTLSLYALLRHLLLGHGWRWYFLGGFAAGLGIFTKGVGFLPVLLLIPFFLLRGFRWRGLATLDAGRGGWRWWLAPLAMLVAVSLWFVPMLIAVAASGSPEYAAYRDEILFKQTVGRYASAWHHVKGWYYFLVEVIPPLWVPWSILLFWLVPRFKAAFQARDARVWLPLGWVLVVLLFFTMSPGKRGIYILPALPALAIASMPLIGDVLARRGVRIAGFVLAGLFLAASVGGYLYYALGGAGFERALGLEHVLLIYAGLCASGLWLSWRRAPLLAWPVALGALAITFSYWLAPVMNGERSGKDFVRSALALVKAGEDLGLVAYKEQFLLYLDRPTVNFGHRRWQEGPQESFDAAAWLNAGEGRVLLVPEDSLSPVNRFVPDSAPVDCFIENVTPVAEQSRDHWFLVRAPAEADCAAKGRAERAIRYPVPSK